MERPRWLRIHLPIQETRVQSLDQEDPLEKEVVTHSSILAWRILWTEELGRCSPWGRWESDTTERLHFPFWLSCIGEGNGNPLQCSCLENRMDRGAWPATVHGVAKSWTRLSDFTFTFDFHALEKEMATHSSVLAWRIPGKGEPGGLLSMGSHRVGHDWSDLAAAAVYPFCALHILKFCVCN